MPRTLSKAAKTALVEGYQNPESLPAAPSLDAQLAEFIWDKTGWERYTAEEVGEALAGLQRPGQPLYRPYHNRAELGIPDGGSPMYEALAQHLNSTLRSRSSPCTAKQVKNALDYFKRNRQLAAGEAGPSDLPPGSPSGSRPGSPFEVVAAPEGEERPVVLHHHGMMFSGQDHVVVPNNEVHYDAQMQQYVDPHGQTVTPHWLDDEFF
ncbi:hypothetical protein JCM8547_005230 [Rhodosporidiobolus lusitaniae]